LRLRQTNKYQIKTNYYAQLKLKKILKDGIQRKKIKQQKSIKFQLGRIKLGKKPIQKRKKRAKTRRSGATLTSRSVYFFFVFYKAEDMWSTYFFEKK
jgi:hypothetical protein